MNIRFLLLSLALVVSCFFPIAGQTYTVPKALSLDRAVKREFPTWLGMPNGSSGLMTEGFYPIGWSRDGKFAYVHEPVDEECGCYFAYLVIQDTNNDKVLWEFKYDQDKLRDPKTDKMPPEDTLRKLWRKQQRLFSRKLRQYGIRPVTSVMLDARGLKLGGFMYDAVADVVRVPDTDHDDQRIDQLKIELASPGSDRGVKILYAVDSGNQDYVNVLDAAVLGVIKSPFQGRIVVITMEINRGWEGPPHTGDVRIVGATLKY